VAAGAVIQNRVTGKILLIHRTASQVAGDIWEIPIGRIEQFESFQDGLKREVAEETGLTDLKVGHPFNTFEFMRGEHTAENEVRAVVFTAQTSQDNITLSHEHDSYKWLSIDDAIELVEQPGIKRDLIAYRDINRLTP